MHDTVNAASGASGIVEQADLHRFGCGAEALGATGAFFDPLAVQLWSRQFDIDTTHDSLPEVGVGLP